MQAFIAQLKPGYGALGPRTFEARPSQPNLAYHSIVFLSFPQVMKFTGMPTGPKGTIVRETPPMQTLTPFPAFRAGSIVTNTANLNASIVCYQTQ